MMSGGPYGGHSFSYYGAHAIPNDDGTMRLGWVDTNNPAYPPHGHWFFYGEDGAYIKSTYTNCTVDCHYAKWNEERPTSDAA